MERQRESELAAAVLRGEPEAFDRFVEYFRAKVFGYSWLMCGQREDAEEVVQEALHAAGIVHRDLKPGNGGGCVAASLASFSYQVTAKIWIAE